MKNPEYAQKTIKDIQVIETKGPWQSKSGGSLNVLFALPQHEVELFLDYDNPSFNEVPVNLRGLRSYTVGEVPAGSIGGKEWHKARTEWITALSGKAILECVDLSGDEATFILDGKTSVIIPPNILHTYQALDDGTALQVIANTIFIPDDPSTHDTYPINSFE